MAGPLADADAGVEIRTDPRQLRDVWKQLNFPRLLFNTAAIAILSTIGAVVSVDARRVRVRAVPVPRPEHAVHHPAGDDHPAVPGHADPDLHHLHQLGWNGTWLPLIVPHLFANAFNVFLLRQYFMSIPRDLDEAAMMDGAGRFRILRSVIVPLSIPGDRGGVAVPLLLRLERLLRAAAVPLGKPELQTLPIAIQQFNALYVAKPNLIQASALMTMAVPVIVFFLAQRAFMRGVVVTGVEK